MRRAAGDNAVALIKREPDPDVARIVEGWPQRFTADQAAKMGFTADKSMDEIIAIYREDELA